MKSLLILILILMKCWKWLPWFWTLWCYMKWSNRPVIYHVKHPLYNSINSALALHHIHQGLQTSKDNSPMKLGQWPWWPSNPATQSNSSENFAWQIQLPAFQHEGTHCLAAATAVTWCGEEHSNNTGTSCQLKPSSLHKLSKNDVKPSSLHKGGYTFFARYQYRS
jgi:hypothetical protein